MRIKNPSILAAILSPHSPWRGQTVFRIAFGSWLWPSEGPAGRQNGLFRSAGGEWGEPRRGTVSLQLAAARPRDRADRDGASPLVGWGSPPPVRQRICTSTWNTLGPNSLPAASARNVAIRRYVSAHAASGGPSQKENVNFNTEREYSVSCPYFIGISPQKALRKPSNR